LFGCFAHVAILVSKISSKRATLTSVIPAVHGCCRFSGFTTMAYPLRVKAGVQCLIQLDSGIRRND
jgi:hypothetical protein